MNRAADLTRGRPVFVLAVILTAWVGGRIAMWEPEHSAMPLTLTKVGSIAPASAAAPKPSTANVSAPAERDPNLSPVGEELPLPWAPPVQVVPQAPLPQTSFGADVAPGNRRAVRPLVGHAMLLSRGRTGTSQLLSARFQRDEPPAARPRPAFVPRAAQLAREETGTDSRFSADAWGLWRDGMDSSVAPGAPSYGRSQAGVVLRYALATGSPHAPEAHLRASMALDGERERDLALGVSARPVANVPIRVAIEGRVTEMARRTEVRAGAYAVSELPPFDLPAGTTGEVYLQGGYVTGQNGTPFIDGHLRVTGDLTEVDDFRLSAGGGVWGGAQEGTERLDVGPTASVSFPIGDGYARVSADYRIRVAGNAEPDSGPALTVATGF